MTTTETPVTNIRSIQGEQQVEAGHGFRRMAQDDVEQVITEIPEDTIDCRAGRHYFPRIRPRDGVVFVGKNKKGQRIQRTRCTGCKLVDRVTLWEGELAIRKGIEEIRWAPVDSRLDYNVRGPNGEQYLLANKGLGRMAPRQVQAALMTEALRGLTFADVFDAVDGEVLKPKPVAAKPATRRRPTRKAG